MATLNGKRQHFQNGPGIELQPCRKALAPALPSSTSVPTRKSTSDESSLITPNWVPVVTKRDNSHFKKSVAPQHLLSRKWTSTSMCGRAVDVPPNSGWLPVFSWLFPVGLLTTVRLPASQGASWEREVQLEDLWLWLSEVLHNIVICGWAAISQTHGKW